MEFYLQEKIGNTELFTGRRREISFLMNWIEKIKPQLSKSMAIISRRKTGKTALLQRIYNILFQSSDGVIPFYYEIREKQYNLIDFSRSYFLTFIYQYLAYKSRNKKYLSFIEIGSYENAYKLAKKERLEFIETYIQRVEKLTNEKTELVWDAVREAPRTIAAYYDERILQIIDEFQLINKMIFRDINMENCIKNMAGSYLHTSEYKNAPMLVAGSWIGWLMNDLRSMLPGRFIYKFFENMPEDEAIEIVYKYSQIEEIPVVEETAYQIAQISEGNPFYISSIFYSMCPEKNLSSENGVLKTLDFETRNKMGIIRATWMEYIMYALSEVNDNNAKNIVLYLCNNRNRQVSRKELREKLNLQMNESDLEKKLQSLVNADIIEQGDSNFYYQGVQDNIFDKVFRSKYEDDIKSFDSKDIIKEYQEMLRYWKKKYYEIRGKYSYAKGLYSEYAIIDNLRARAFKNSKFYKKITSNLPDDFQFVKYNTVWSYTSAPIEQTELQVDIFARAADSEYTIIGEVKNREKAKFSIDEAKGFFEKANYIVNYEKIKKYILIVFSLSGFTDNSIDFFHNNSIAWSNNDKWLNIN